jgi:hypothetical protein
MSIDRRWRGAVLAVVVVVEEGLGDSLAVSFEGEGVGGHFGYGFEDDALWAVEWGVAAPAEGGVAVEGWRFDEKILIARICQL